MQDGGESSFPPSLDSAPLPDSRGPAAESPREHERELPACGAVGRGSLAAPAGLFFRKAAP